MRSLWRLLLLVIVAVALPVQAFAAAGAVHCARMHERMHAAAAQASHDHHVHHGMAAAHHDMSADSLSAAPASPTDVPDEGTPLHAFKCSACAACCVAMGLPAATPKLPSAPAAAETPSLPAIAIAAFVTGGLERPPRTELA